MEITLNVPRTTTLSLSPKPKLLLKKMAADDSRSMSKTLEILIEKAAEQRGVTLEDCIL